MRAAARSKRWPAVLNEILNAFLLVYAGLFPIVNPVGGAPLFLGLTRGVSAVDRRGLAFGVSRNSFLLLLGSLFIGSHVLVFFGITLPVVRIAGGVVVAAFAWQLLHSGTDAEERSGGDAAGRLPVDAFYPLTLPLTVGPGSISVAITLGSQRPVHPEDWTQLASVGIGGVAGILAIAITVYVCYAYAEDIVAVLGKHGSSVLVRLSAFILFCIGIQIIWNGWQSLNAAATAG